MFWSAIVHWFMAYGQELIWIVSDLEKECLENWWGRHLPNGQGMWRYLCSLSMVIGRWLHLRRSSIKYIGWPILWKIRLFPEPSLPLPNMSVNKVAMVAEIGLCIDSIKWNHTKSDLTAAAAEYQFCQQQRPTQSPVYGIIPSVTSYHSGVRLSTLDHFFCGKEDALSLLE